jgi:hypothetical protein
MQLICVCKYLEPLHSPLMPLPVLDISLRTSMPRDGVGLTVILTKMATITLVTRIMATRTTVTRIMATRTTDNITLMLVVSNNLVIHKITDRNNRTLEDPALNNRTTEDQDKDLKIHVMDQDPKIHVMDPNNRTLEEKDPNNPTLEDQDPDSTGRDSKTNLPMCLLNKRLWSSKWLLFLTRLAPCTELRPGFFLP